MDKAAPVRNSLKWESWEATQKYMEVFMKYKKHVIEENCFFIYEYDHIIEYKEDGHILKQYTENEKRTKKKRS